MSQSKDLLTHNVLCAVLCRAWLTVTFFCNYCLGWTPLSTSPSTVAISTQQVCPSFTTTASSSELLWPIPSLAGQIAKEKPLGEKPCSFCFPFFPHPKKRQVQLQGFLHPHRGKGAGKPRETGVLDSGVLRSFSMPRGSPPPG